MSQFDTAIHSARNSILNGSLKEAEHSLKKIKAFSKPEKRQLKHYLGIIELRRGRVQSAVSIFQEAIDQYGPHLFLLLDLSAAHYLSGDAMSWQHCLERAEFEFRQSQDFLSKISRLKFLLTFAKMREEQGELAKAFCLYKELVAESISLKNDDQLFPLKNKGQAQILRIQSSYQFEKLDFDIYNYLIQLNAEKTNIDCSFEVEHALLAYEIRKFGGAHAIARFNKISKSEIMKTAEGSLIFGDFLFDLLLLGLEIPQDLILSVQKLGPLPPFETQVLALANKKNFSLEDSLNWPSLMSPSSYAKLVILASKLFPEELVLKKILPQLLGHLSPASKKIWVNFIDSTLAVRADSLTFNPERKILQLKEDFITIENNSEFDLLKQLLEVEVMSIADLSQRLWNGSGDESDQARLRMRINRLNKKLTDKFSVKKFITMSKTQVILQSRLQRSS